MRHRATTAQRGYSLVGCLVTATTASLVAATAIPVYDDYIRRSHRAHARVALAQAARWMESVATATGAYPTANTRVQSVALPGDRYTLSASSANGQTYTLFATPTAAQAADGCGTLVMAPAGQRSVRHARLSVQECWPR
ncbi:type IV pilin protein [Pseudorhodoferax sp. Leaf267]|uniref:type IV pilin protein n=1 Tax=Pseudorhodoferax sp. Leaf267 TaxID=1736316 RepID=UPI0006FDC47D|nr:type IV pilin protein [Pseudorhodoferax sp. Leaf267]KQP14359.1 hypothetical protein ASF43_16240 [Pseudorhodoferax sp. Leaf267]